MKINTFIDEIYLGSIKLLSINNPPINALTNRLCDELLDAIEEGITNNKCNAIIVASSIGIFSAGADVNDFDVSNYEPTFPKILNAIENANKPIIAALNGMALGGGFELALACHYRVSFTKNKIGLPEVKLGLIPGAGGTQRLPRLIGFEKALDMIVTGKTEITENFSKLFDEIVPLAKDVVPKAESLAKEIINNQSPIPKTSEIPFNAEECDRELFINARKSLGEMGGFAQQSCINAIEAAMTAKTYEEGANREQKLFKLCLQSEEAKAKLHYFKSERAVSHVADFDITTPTVKVQKVAIIGAGTMGSGIAINFLNAGIPVTLLDIDKRVLEAGIMAIRKNYKRLIEKGKLSSAIFEQRMDLLVGSADYESLADVDVVIEAVFEKLSLKKEIFKTLDKICKKGAILATNTSSLDINEIANVTKRPEDVIGLHFFSPANIMKLLEVVKTSHTSPIVIKTCMKLAKKINKVAVLVKVCFGFVGNRMIECYIREANRLVLEGASPEQIDKVICHFGFPMGPFQMTDMAGLDVSQLVRNSRPELLEKDHTYCAFADALLSQGRTGIKVGKGTYLYEKSSRQPTSDPEVMALSKREAKRLNITQREISNNEILERLLYPLINEGANILMEGIATKSSDIDVIYILGYGFPLSKGGPMHYANQKGLARIYETLCRYKDSLGHYGECWYSPSPMLKRLATENSSF